MSAARQGTIATFLPFVIFTAIWGSTWIVIRDQIGINGAHVAPQWSVTYRFAIAAAAMAVMAALRGESLTPNRRLIGAATFIGVSQFCVNFNGVYLAEHFITSGLVATVFALLVIPNTLLGWAFLNQRPSAQFLWGSLVAVAGILLLFVHELQEHPARSGQILAGIGLTLAGMVSASSANIFQARDGVRAHPLFALLAWSMAIGALVDAALALAVAGPPTIEPRWGYWAGLVYLALIASALAFSLYFPFVRRFGPAKAAYSSVLVPVIAMGFSTWLESYRWTLLAAAGAGLAMAGMLGALSRSRSTVSAPDAG